LPGTDADRLAHMLEAAKKATSIVEGLSASDFKADDVRALAVTHLLEILGEASKGVSEATKASHKEIPWANMAATRDRLIHGYFSVDLDVVWQIVHNDLPPLIPAIEAVRRDA
jgi:uncharacterized protein with HEPN domain